MNAAGSGKMRTQEKRPHIPGMTRSSAFGIRLPLAASRFGINRRRSPRG
jgi:hypothetical protein